MIQQRFNGTEIALIGMDGRFPGAPNLHTFWHNLQEGVESIQTLSDDQLRQAGIDEALIHDPHYVKATAFLEDADKFDADFFNMSYREAEITDPQQRVLLECAWAALEHAGYNPLTYPGAISVFAGATMNTYLLFNLTANPTAVADLEPVQLNIGNAGDFLATRIAYKLNLKGASYTLQSACSTSLVAVHVACEALLNEECDMALAGGASVNISLRHGYHYVEGGMASPDGRCRPFDARAQGTIFGSGAGIVVLKRLQKALADGDTIHAIIKGSATNNDGSLKVGYTAPSVDGQAQVVAEALANAGLRAEAISYIEAHGTATPLGDPIEIQALTKAFRADTQATGFCAIGSVKSNFGHLDAAAGIAGLIKTVLALKHKQVPPSLHFESPNPNIDFARSPFYVNTTLTDWHVPHGYRRAGVSAFGVGGTNAHVILEEGPPPQTADPSRPWQLLCLSAKTETAAEQIVANLAAYLPTHSRLNLADVAYTLQVGRQGFDHRRFILARDLPEAAAALSDPAQVFSGRWHSSGAKRPLAFMFTGQGAQHANMGRHLYQQEPRFREEIAHCALTLRSELGFDLRDLLYPQPGQETDANEQLRQTAVAQPALFAVEYALGQLFLSWGIEPQAVAGHSIGEYVAACLAGIFTLEDALKLVAARGRLMQTLPGGAMLAVPLPEFELKPFLQKDLALAAVNGPSRSVVSGPPDAIEQLAQQLERAGVATRRLHTSHAFHSPMMDPILDPFTEIVGQIQRQAPQIPILSNTTGTWLTAEEATSAAYWVRHLRQTVRFTDNLAQLLGNEHQVLLEVGPGEMLSRLARRHPSLRPEHQVITALRHPHDTRDDLAVALRALGQLWLAGVEPDWSQFYGHERRLRVPLPTYPFARQRHWIEPEQGKTTPQAAQTSERQPLDDWFYIPAWRRILPPRLDQERLRTEQRHWLLFADAQGLASQLAQTLTKLGQPVTIVRKGERFGRGQRSYTLNPTRRSDYEQLVLDLQRDGHKPDVVLHLWSLGDTAVTLSFAQVQAVGYQSLLYFMQAVDQAAAGGPQFDLLVVTDQAVALTAQETLRPAKATLPGLCKVIPHEYQAVRCQVVDVGGWPENQPAGALLAIALNGFSTPLACRGRQWWAQTYQSISVPARDDVLLHPQGVYLFTGGLLEIGQAMVRHLAQTYQARLVLLEEAPFPPPEQWQAWLANHPPYDPVSDRITQARALIDMGAEVLVLGVDWKDSREVQTAVDQAVARFGSINGVIHNARVLGERSFRTIAETGPTESTWQFDPKIHGLVNLAQALSTQPLDFFLLNSSLSSVLGGIGMAAYAAANRFVDAFAWQQHQTQRGIWTSVNWDAWQQTQVSAVSAAWAQNALTAAEGTTVMERILSLGMEQVVVSTVDLASRVKSRQKQAESDGSIEANGHQTRHPRPALAIPYTPPANDREQAIAEIWQQLLGVEQIGVLDNFFDLGGDSLLAIQIAKHLKQSFAVDFPVVSLYEGLTIRALAQIIDEQKKGTSDSAAAARMEREKRVSRRRKIQQQQRRKRRERQR